VNPCGTAISGWCWAVPVLAAACGQTHGQDWPQFARGPNRVSVSPGATAPPLSLAMPRWVLSQDSSSNPITFVGQAGVAAGAGRVVAVGRVGGQFKVFCVDAAAGSILWAQPVPATILDSWSTPAIDLEHSLVLVASGAFLTALDLASGQARWQAALSRSVVNASPLVTSDLGPADRAFITDYDGFGGAGRLYCVNIDPFDAQANPHQPGEIVWSVVLGTTSGNTPAYRDGVVYVASVSDESGTTAGRVMGFPATAAAAPAPLWVFTNPAGPGFFGGVCIAGDGDGWVYAASYSLLGGHMSSNLVKLDAGAGAMAWSVPCNRTDATPIPLPGGLVAVSGGVAGFGSMPSLGLFRDDGPSATMLWDSALETWVDTNQNGWIDPGECMIVGGWTHQPALVGGRLYTGAVPVATPGFGACTDVYAIDLLHRPGEAGFILGHAQGMGSTPAAAGGNLYTVGSGGLYAFGPECYANCDGSGVPPVLNVSDYVCFLTRYSAGDPWANCDQSSVPPVLNISDFVCFANRFAGGCL